MTRPLDTTMWTQKDIEAQINDNVALRKQIAELESLCEVQSNNLQRYADSERRHNQRNSELRQRIAELEFWCVRAQDAMRRMLSLQISSAELKELRDSAPVEKVT